MDLAGDTGARPSVRPDVAERASSRAFLGACVLAFAASVAATIAWCNAMSAMDGMSMPGGWTMSMAWTPTPGRSWLGVSASFIAMWQPMMVAMMLPSLVPMLVRYRSAAGGSGGSRLGRLTVLVAAGYFFVWFLFGIAVFPFGAALAALAMHTPAIARAVPFAVGGVCLVAGALQFTAWKQRCLASCRVAASCGGRVPADPAAAWRHGVRLGLHCARCCSGPMAMLLAVDVMDLRVMALVTAAITVERLAPASRLAAHATGVGVVGAAAYLLAGAAALA